MKTKSFIQLTILFAIFLSVAPSLVLAGTYGTVTTKSGEEFRDVYITVNSQYKVLELTKDSVSNNVSFTDVEKVVDPNGNDITADLIQGHYKPKDETWDSKNSEKRISYNESLYSVGFGAYGLFSVPFGDYYKGIDAGIGFEGNIIIPIDRQKAVRLIVSKSGMKIDSPLKLTAIKFVGALQYNSHYDEFAPGNSIGYGYSGIGIISHKFSADFTSGSYSETDLLFNVGGGVIIPTSPSLGIDLSGNLDAIYGTMSGYDGISYGFQIEFRIGLVFFAN